MKLLFIINDSFMQYMEYSETGNLRALKRRSIEIELSEEQVKQIGLSEDERIESISLLLSSKQT